MIQVPGYLIKKEIGKGGMATVWLAVQASLEREVALKVMQPTLANDPNFSRRFLQEARTLASLSHPNIVAVYDVGVTDAQLHYFSMQHLPGGDFSDRIAKGIPEWEVVRVLSGIGRALAFAHHRGFIHRDVSPANVLFDASENPILTDFGIARAVTRTSRLTNAGVSVGTSQYMSPEQARGGDVDTRSDIYSLGCVTYEGLTGKPPYQGEDGFAIAYAHVFEPVPRLPEHLTRWQPLIDKALAKSPTDRFTTVDEFVSMLDEIGSTIEFPAGQSPATRPMQIVTPAAIAAANAAAEAKTDPLPSAAPAAAPAPTAARATTQSTAGAKPAVSTTAKTTVRQSVKLPPPASTPKPAVAARGDVAGRKTGMMIGIAVIALAVLGTLGYLGKEALTDPEDSPAATASTPTASTTAPAPSTTTSPAPTTTTVPATGTIAPVTDPNAIAGIDPDAPLDPNAPYDPNDQNALGPDGQPLVGPDVAALTPEEAEALRIAVATTAIDPLATVLSYAKSDLAARRYTTPPGRNALERYRLAERLAAKFKAKRESDTAREGIVAVASGYVELAEKRLTEGKEPEFLDFLKRAEEIAASLPEGASVIERVRGRRAGLRDEALARGRTALEAWDRAAATAAFERALVFDANSKDAIAGLKTAKTVGDPGYRFRDENGPELVVADVGGKRLAVARTETTVADFQRYWSAQGSRARGGDRPGCRNRESIALFGTGKARTFQKPDITQAGNHPVVCVSQGDATDYAKWLSKSTGKKYRLPSASEWAALARGAPAADACGGNVGDAKLRARFNERDAYACDDGFAETAKVASFKPSGAGVYDIVGNVREWVSDTAGKSRIAMGLGWASGKDKPSPTQRTTFDSDVASNTVGFRVVREID